MSEPEARCWFIDQSRTEVLQVQRDRFIRNWRKITGNEPYPSYDFLKPRFERDWVRFIEFLDREEIARPEVNQCEVTYINHIAPSGGDETERPPLHRVLVGIASPQSSVLPPPEDRQLIDRFVIRDNDHPAGRVHVSAVPAFRTEDRTPIYVLTLTARLRAKAPDVEGALGALDRGRELLDRAFMEMTTPEMHQRWELQEADEHVAR